MHNPQALHLRRSTNTPFRRLPPAPPAADAAPLPFSPRRPPSAPQGPSPRHLQQGAGDARRPGELLRETIPGRESGRGRPGELRGQKAPVFCPPGATMGASRSSVMSPGVVENSLPRTLKDVAGALMMSPRPRRRSPRPSRGISRLASFDDLASVRSGEGIIQEDGRDSGHASFLDIGEGDEDVWTFSMGSLKEVSMAGYDSSFHGSFGKVLKPLKSSSTLLDLVPEVDEQFELEE
eukprot:CAMPEP_0184712862 /NCGR_PEP_ID=MMETSP0314-20130426/3326_1 /TAXON_ID=38298 /ORGANISM="Rhodella maculata, Strain CCMP 736" /LENGTH=235 /DNA_ID=CAMNT_0027175387 /DNA_START=28 /DNA_END=735 /DNA_ORIENTATION=+